MTTREAICWRPTSRGRAREKITREAGGRARGACEARRRRLPVAAGKAAAPVAAGALPWAADAAEAQRFLAKLHDRLDQEELRTRLECKGIFVPEGIHLPGNYLPEGIPGYEPCTYPSALDRERLRRAVMFPGHRWHLIPDLHPDD